MKTNEEKVYGEWIRRRQSVPVPEGFTGRTMTEIAGQAAAKRLEPTVCGVLFSHPMQWAAAVGALLLGLFRLSYITRALLIP
jgi:hypothetical protein